MKNSHPILRMITVSWLVLFSIINFRKKHSFPHQQFRRKKKKNSPILISKRQAYHSLIFRIWLIWSHVSLDIWVVICVRNCDIIANHLYTLLVTIASRLLKQMNWINRLNLGYGFAQCKFIDRHGSRSVCFRLSISIYQSPHRIY